MTRLSVNVNKLATLRNAREKNLPDVALMAKKILAHGANGITVHPRPDGRHIRLSDVSELHDLVCKTERAGDESVEYNIEGYPSDDFMTLIEQIKPHQCTLVPDPPEAITSNAGWNLLKDEALLARVLTRLRKTAVRVSLFIDPKTFHEPEAKALNRLRPDRIELYTEAYSDHFHKSDRDEVTRDYVRAAQIARDHKIGVNAGHDLNQENLGFLLEKIPWLDEVSIGHALICEALEQGLENTIHNYLRILKVP